MYFGFFMLSDEDKEDFIQAGKIAAKVREESKKLIIVEESLLDIAETIEQMIRDEGANCAFPVNISLNEKAAHFTPETDCELLLSENDVVKIDLGAEVNNALSDTAYTIDLSGKLGKLIEASEKALAKAITMMTPGTKVSEVSGAIEDTIKAYGFVPISNLTGHMIKKGLLHAGIDIPNVRINHPYTLKDGDIFAIEPFASTGSGVVQDTDQVEIFSLINPKPLRMLQARKIEEQIMKERKLLPFAQRWLNAKNSRLIVNSVLREMIAQKIVISYPVLKDSGNGIVSQFEHTVVVGEKPLVLTL